MGQITLNHYLLVSGLLFATGLTGVIVDAEGRGSDARVQVNFRESGLKWLALEYAKLEPA